MIFSSTNSMISPVPAAQDSEKGKGWKRFEFDKDVPLEDEEIEVAEDDASLVKQIGQSFRYSKIVARREEQIQAAHDEAMFGASVKEHCYQLGEHSRISNLRLSVRRLVETHKVMRDSNNDRGDGSAARQRQQRVERSEPSAAAMGSRAVQRQR
ncbi:uncharacterized protein LOC110268400 [Arachis ipaensis]|uniref:uncharacterized protein LOC110268400 n=1 Tax=Arachis ipaensis TaxID=130454 RepID=UPI000A2B61BB|nr:uncharacterized protein LOC110268400 [Arachis ipaensis]